jgi:hypothetical protein
MLDFNSLKEVYTQMKSVPADQRGPFVTSFVWLVVAYCVYYLVAGFIVYTLGKRLIQASFAAYKEARRERAA